MRRSEPDDPCSNDTAEWEARDGPCFLLLPPDESKQPPTSVPSLNPSVSPSSAPSAQDSSEPSSSVAPSGKPSQTPTTFKAPVRLLVPAVAVAVVLAHESRVGKSLSREGHRI